MTDHSSDIENECRSRKIAFLEDLGSGEAEERLVQRHLIHTNPAGLTRSEFIRAREWIAEKIGLHPSSVAIVGSCQTGFSLKNKKRIGRYALFNPGSDVDVALVDHDLYQALWTGMLDRISDRKLWCADERNRGFQAAKWQGWISTEHVVRAFLDLDRAVHLQETFETATRQRLCGFRDITCRVYHGWYFLESYQRIMVRQCVAEARLDSMLAKTR